MSISQKDLDELQREGIISDRTAREIHAHFREKANRPRIGLLAIFAVLGALLIALGVLLILAHNWDDLDRFVRLLLSFLPLISGQALCVFARAKRSGSAAWMEASSVFLTISVGCCIALIAQIFNIPGNFATFMLTWSLLALPLVYLMRSGVTSMLYIIGITIYAIAESSVYPSAEPYLYLPLLGAIIPFYLQLSRDGNQAARQLHHWVICISGLIALATFAGRFDELHWVSYISMLALFYLIGTSEWMRKDPAPSNAYRVLGDLGTVCALLPLSFDYFWKQLRGRHLNIEIFNSPEIWCAMIFTLASLIILLKRKPDWKRVLDEPICVIFVLFPFVFALGYRSIAPVFIVNALLLGIGLLTIRRAIQEDHLGWLNYGLLIVTVLVACRFFDTNLSFVVRGLLFIVVGAAFISSNVRLLKNRRAHEK